MKKILPEQINENTMKLIGKDWMLVCAQKSNGEINAMTASWGGMGVMWGKNVVFTVIRPQRYTKEFIDSAEYFSLTFFDEKYKDILGYMGKVSGRDENKIEKSKLTVAEGENAPYFKEAKLTLICKKLYKQPMDKRCFIDSESDTKWYANGDYHDLYIAEITDVLTEE